MCPSALKVDFLAGRLQFRIKQAQHQGDPLLKAFGLKPNHPVTLVDATAGLGQDAFLLASLGHTLILFEKNETVHALLADGLTRALASPLTDIIAKRMTLIRGDATLLLPTLDPRPDFIYLDPMFPEKKKSALSKQSMELLKQIADISEQPELLTIARQIAGKRVVVKRPKHAPAFGNQAPNFSHVYQSCRFDVYVQS